MSRTTADASLAAPDPETRVLGAGAFARDGVAAVLHAAATRPAEGWRPHVSYNG
ncbi:hypothetical protein ABZ552_28090 [Nocardia sp. NPDC019219]|uniref:hypothetical protein n=1 Tax=Nocardia TaxID=1817 RepID=UPI00249148A6|nr:hypothetical protein [Nocardia sputorum]